MFLSTLLGATSGRRGSFKSSRSKQSQRSPDVSPSRPRNFTSSTPEYLSDESQIQPASQPPPDVLDLNQNLERLAALFPDIQVEVFREMLASFSEESRLFIITDKLLKNPGEFVKGRRRASEHTGSDSNAPVSRTEAFRTAEYKKAVRTLAAQEFKGLLSRSSIDAVLSEFNYSYLDARQTLVDLSSKTWKFTISTFLFRRKPVTSAEAETHPLIIWKAADDGLMVPTLKATGSAELDRELFEELIMPLKEREQLLREERDRAMAVSLLTEDAEAHEAMFECGCCYSDVIFEEITTCTAEGHVVCFNCVRHSITEAVFGQGWQRSIEKETGALRCPAVASVECESCVSPEHIHRAMQGEKNGDEIIRKLDQRLAEHGLLSSGLPLVRCPFCTYAEVDDLYMPASISRPRIRVSNIPNFIIIFICLIISPLLFPILILALAFAVLCLNRSFRDYMSCHLGAAVIRYQRRRRGLKFNCQNPTCRRSSCLSCSKAWVDVHVCHESSLVALRTQVEQAMSMAIKRVCPRCSTSFVKTAGCNKLTCPCGYKMCYVCRKNIGTPNEGYQHFCQHFRPEGDGRQCGECSKCNLWEAENTEEILRKAKMEAERKWRASERRELSDAEKAYLEDGVGSFSRDKSLTWLLPGGKIPSIEEFCDFIIETLFI